MSGLFGGYLYVVETVGGFVLYILIGGKAWTESDDGRFFRLATGSIVIGAIVGFFISAAFLKHIVEILTIGGLVGSVVSCTFTAILSKIRHELSK